MFSDSIKVTVEDVHFILGPNTNNISQDCDFQSASFQYDTANPINNIVKMFKMCKEKSEKEKLLAKSEEEVKKSAR